MRFSVLDGWRGVAACLIVIFHSAFYGHLYSIPFIRNSWLFVDFFFVLSGFVITHAYINRLRTREEYISFLIRRFGRLWPLHAAVLICYVGLEILKLIAVRKGSMNAESAPFQGHFSIESLFTNAILIQSLGIHDDATWNSPSWSISTELYVYVAFALVVFLFRSFTTMASAIICLCSAYVLLRYSPHIMHTTYDFGFFRCLYGFFLGHIVYRIYARQVSAKRGIAFPSIVEILILTVVFLFISGMEPESGLAVLATLLFAVMVYIFAFEAGAVSRLLQGKIFHYLGTWSYSIYLIHMLISQMIRRGAKFTEQLFKVSIFQQIEVDQEILLTTSLPNAAYWMDLLNFIYLIVVIAVSCGTYYFIEEPARNYFNKLSRRFSDGASPRTAATTEDKRTTTATEPLLP